MKTFHRRLAALAIGLLAACGGKHGGAAISHVQPPSDLLYPGDLSLYVVDVAIAPNVPAFAGSVDHFSISPPLPAGLALDPASGAISGTPAQPQAHTLHTVTASNAGGATTCTIGITVVNPARFAYAIGADDSTISIFSDDAVTGRLHRKGYVLAAAGEVGPEMLVVHPSGRFLYAPNATTNNVSVYAIDATSGWLTAGAPASAGAGPHRMVIDPAGNFAYVTDRNADDVRVYAIDPLTGALTAAGEPVATGVQPSALALDPAGKLLFVALRGDATTGAGSALAVFAVDTTSGTVAPIGSPLALGNSKPGGVSVDVIHDAVYVIEAATNTIAAFRFDPTSGALASLGADATAAQPSAVSAHPLGRFAYVTDDVAGSNPGIISVFRVDATSGDLVAAGTAASGIHPTCVTVDPTGRFAYVAGHDSRNITQFAIDPASGALEQVDDVLTRNSPVDFAIVQGPHAQSWIPRFVHVTNGGSNDVSVYTVNPANGALTETAPTAAVGNTPVSLASDPRLRFMYVADGVSSDVGSYAINSANGNLAEVAPKTLVAGHPTHIVVDPAGRFAYVVATGVADPNAGWLTTLAIASTLGTLTEIDMQPITGKPMWVATDPTGQFLYVANNGTGDPGTGNVATFRLQVATGVPISVGTSPAPGVNGLGFHPTGKYMYATLKNANGTIEYTIDTSSGALVLFPGVARAGLEPMSISVSPDGRRSYVAFQNSFDTGHTAFFPLDPLTEFPQTPAQTYVDGLHPVDLGVDPSGRFLYVANSGSNNVSLMTIDPATGELTIGAPKACGLAPSAVLVSGVTQ
jgi:6-phosphogluconolactonase (cycloisomerase 2 family)